MRVAEIMTSATVTDSTTGTLRNAAEQMWRQQLGSLVIVDGDALVGIITERDVLRAMARGADPDIEPISDVMTRDVITVSPDTHVRDAARLMAQHWIRHLPIVDAGRLVGILSQRDVTGVFAALWHETGAPEIDVDGLVRQRRLARVEAGDLD
ncbi:cyclic nucleotide-binding/CBS domain-containing protein [Jiangella asiatica]|uniref:CBS domain-containing protein n=1 Tax=Jiangella asiatica TaxID=2530372 RepID=A0A4R5DCW6_9ACTN|nr:CBS domain-containing protein [Jiangella asiatica]TDE08375.1 CBS domain-containing protein [Jiangella asiatica]